VEGLGIGFPPGAGKCKLKSGIVFSVNWLPLGGFVKLQGEHDSASQPGDYGRASFWQKTKILLAGVAINWLAAAVILSCLALVGLPKILPNQFAVPSDSSVTTGPVEVGFVDESMPAGKAGLQPGDELVSLDGSPIANSDALSQMTEQSRGETVEIAYKRDGESKVADVKLRSDNKDERGYLGVSSGQRETIKATWSAPIVGFGTAAQFTWVTLEGLGNLVSDLVGGLVMQIGADEATKEQASAKLERAGASVAGPVGILGVIFPEASQAGFVQVAYLTAIISLTLAIMNALPIPALDGGRWFTMVIFRLLKRPLTKEREEAIQATGFLVLIGLILLVTVADVIKIF